MNTGEYNNNNNNNKMLIVQYLMQFSGRLRNISTHVQHRFAQRMVVQLTQLGFMHFIHIHTHTHTYKDILIHTSLHRSIEKTFLHDFLVILKQCLLGISY